MKDRYKKKAIHTGAGKGEEGHLFALFCFLIQCARPLAESSETFEKTVEILETSFL